MNIYLLKDPMRPGTHPMFGHVGTWSVGGICKSCGRGTSVLVEPLLVEWDSGSLDLGDFSWCSYTAIVLDRLKSWLIKNNFEVQFGKVEVVKPKLPKYRMPRIAFPYTGPDLHWLICETFVRLDEKASGIEPVPDCPVCGQKQTKFTREGIFIPKSNWNGEKIFQIEQNRKSSAKFITEEALELMRTQAFTNYLVTPAGRIGD
jgi:hypothetical protein